MSVRVSVPVLSSAMLVAILWLSSSSSSSSNSSSSISASLPSVFELLLTRSSPSLVTSSS